MDIQIYISAQLQLLKPKCPKCWWEANIHWTFHDGLPGVGLAAPPSPGKRCTRRPCPPCTWTSLPGSPPHTAEPPRSPGCSKTPVCSNSRKTSTNHQGSKNFTAFPPWNRRKSITQNGSQITFNKESLILANVNPHPEICMSETFLELGGKIWYPENATNV